MPPFFEKIMAKTIDQRQREIRHQLNLRRNQQMPFGTIQGGKRADLDYGYFRSKWEANYARYLTQLEIEWKYEPKTFWFDGIKSGTVNYTPDFYIPAEDTWIEVKGQWDSKSKTKLRRFKKYYPKEFTKLLVVTGDVVFPKSKTAKSVLRFLIVTLGLPRERIISYPAIAHKYKSIISNWE